MHELSKRKAVRFIHWISSRVEQKRLWLAVRHAGADICNVHRRAIGLALEKDPVSDPVASGQKGQGGGVPNTAQAQGHGVGKFGERMEKNVEAIESGVSGR